MLREVQAHFENQGSLNWTAEIADPFRYLHDFIEESSHVVHDQKTGQYYLFFSRTITAMIIKDVPQDPYERLYAPGERKEQENNQQEYQGNDSVGSSTESSGRSRPRPS